MELRKIASKKSIKLLTLLLTSMLIATASAGVYYSLNMTSTISTMTPYVYFVKGLDNVTAGVSLSADNRSASLTTLKAYPNVTTTYDDPIRVRNNHTSLSANVRLRPVSLSGAATNFVFVNFTLTWMNGTEIASLDYTSNTTDWTIPSETSFESLSNSTEWVIKVETQAIPNAASDSVDIEIKVDVED